MAGSVADKSGESATSKGAQRSGVSSAAARAAADKAAADKAVAGKTAAKKATTKSKRRANYYEAGGSRPAALNDPDTRAAAEHLLNKPITADVDPVKAAEALEATRQLMLGELQRIDGTWVDLADRINECNEAFHPAPAPEARRKPAYKAIREHGGALNDSFANIRADAAPVFDTPARNMRAAQVLVARKPETPEEAMEKWGRLNGLLTTAVEQQ